MKEFLKRLKGDKAAQKSVGPKVGGTWYCVQFDYRYPRDLFVVVALQYYGSTATTIDQYIKMGWAFESETEARMMADKVNKVIKEHVL